MFDHTSKLHLEGPKHANVPMSARGPVRPAQHKRDPKFEKAQVAKDLKVKEPAPVAKKAETPKRLAVKPFPGEKGAPEKPGKSIFGI